MVTMSVIYVHVFLPFLFTLFQRIRIQQMESLNSVVEFIFTDERTLGWTVPKLGDDLTNVWQYKDLR